MPGAANLSNHSKPLTHTGPLHTHTIQTLLSIANLLTKYFYILHDENVSALLILGNIYFTSVQNKLLYFSIFTTFHK